MNKTKTEKQSSNETIMLIKNIDVSKFVHVKQVYNEKTTYALKYKLDNGKLEDIGIQLPLMRAPFGIKNVDDPKYNPNNENKWSINLSLDTSEKYNKTGAIDKLIEFMRSIDDINCKYLAANSKEIYGSVKTADNIRENLYSSVIIEPSDKAQQKAKESNKTFHSNIRAKVQVYKDGNPGFKAFMEQSKDQVDEIKLTTPDVDENGVQLKTQDGKPKFKINWDIFNKSFDCRVILKCDKISVIGKKATYFNWKLYVIKIIASSKKEITKEVFLEDDDEEEQQDEIKETVEEDQEEVEEEVEENDDEES